METTRIEANGQRTIVMFDSSPLAMSKPSKLSYYRGAVRSGSVNGRLEACNAILFKRNELEPAEEFYAKLIQVDHPCVVKALGFANGDGENINYSFVALEPFDMTLVTYIMKHIPGADQNGRLTKDFITLIDDSIKGLEELHSLEFYCPHLKGDDVAVIKKSGLISAKIWNFQKCDPGMEEEQKDGDWLRLSSLIVSVSCIPEVANLVKKIKNGKLKGKSIMKNSALLTVRKKFENVLAFHLHISIHCQPKPNQSQNEDNLKAAKPKQSQNKDNLLPAKLCAANLVEDMDRKLAWQTPGWAQGRGLPISTKTLRGFVNQIRIFVEHEIFYVPEEMTRDLTPNELLDGKKKKDLEHQLQGESCGKVFRAVQRLVAELNLEY